MNTSKAELRAGIRVDERSAARYLWLTLIVVGGLLLRLLFIGNEGFKNDVASFESWALTLASHPFLAFYHSTSFADYPPGYFYVLWAVGHVYTVISPHGNYDLLKYLVKMPAIVMDMVDGVLLYAVVRRFASERWALGAAAFFLFNPAIVFISAAWGQVDSISGGLALLGVYLLLTSDDFTDNRAIFAITGAWLALAYSLLIKPQGAVVIPLFLAFALTDRARMRTRLIGTIAGVIAAFVLALVVTLPFHPTGNPVDAFAWLLGKYAYGKNVYAYNSVNAFNLWAMWHQFWRRDSLPLFGLPQYVWGVALVVVAVILVVLRYWQARTQSALLESSALLSLAFFMLATRMHERYIYDGLLLTIACMPLARRYLWASVIFSGTLLVNLFYSLTYLSVVTNSTPNVNPRDMWPAVTHPLSILNVVTFFFLGYVFLGQTNEEAAAAIADARGIRSSEPSAIGAFALRARNWFDPREGLAKMAWPLDYIAAGFFGAVSFVVSYVNYWLPNEKIFDEIYFARAAEEYLRGKYIYENTHPPLTKLIITLSTMLFGGLPGGDNPAGWRFLDVLFGAVAVVLIYAFAKRLTRSSLFASFAAIMFTADGMHFVQSRIATPEGIVIVFSLGALYAFYRYWIASQSTVRACEPNGARRVLASAAGAIVLGGLSGYLANLFGNPPALTPMPNWITPVSLIVASAYFSFGWYLLLRLVVMPRIFGTQGEYITYADGTRVLKQGQLTILPAYDREVKNKDVTVKEAETTFVYRRDGTVSYHTPEGSATYAPGIVTDDLGETQQGRHATTWLVMFTVLLGALVASKWYGVMAYGVSFTVIAFVWLQRFWAQGRGKRWGNPYGFRLDVAVATIVFISMSVYVAVWIPDLTRHVSPGDTGVATLHELVYRQYTMFEYHDHLVATHPYQSVWWQWPLDLRPIAYYWKDLRTGAGLNNPNACCVAEITSLPNPLILWFGLICVPLVAVLAWYEKNKGYALLVLAYLLQWLPWAESPRLTFAYHFYVDIPLIVLCNVIVLQRVWNWASDGSRAWGRIAVGCYVGAVVLAFIWFYPILAGVPIPWSQWWARMWLGSHWV